MPPNYKRTAVAVDPKDYQKFIVPITTNEIEDLAVTNAKLAGSIARAKMLEGLGRYGEQNQLLTSFIVSGDSSNSTTSDTYTQMKPRSTYIDFDELIKITGTTLWLRLIADIKISIATETVWLRVTNEPFAGATPAGATRAELSHTGDTNFTPYWSSWWDVSDWTGKHEFNFSFKRTGTATAYCDMTALQMAYKLV